MKPLLLLMALTSPAASAATLTLAPGQTGLLADQKITLLRVSDSRCPPGVMCIWAGEINATVLSTKGNTTRTLKLKFPEAQNTTWAGLRILNATPKTNSSKGLKLTFTDVPAK